MSNNLKLKSINIYNKSDFINLLKEGTFLKNNQLKPETSNIQLPSNRQINLIEQLKQIILNKEELEQIENILKTAAKQTNDQNTYYTDYISEYFSSAKGDYLDGTTIVDKKSKSLFQIPDTLQLSKNKLNALNDQMMEADYDVIAPYVFKKHSATDDIAFILSKKYPKLVYSHETALYYHDLSDVYPYYLHATVENSYNPRISIFQDNVQISRSRQLIDNEEIDFVATSSGNYIPITDKERTICDCFQPRYPIDREVRSKILTKYFDSNFNSPKKLKRKAIKLGVWDQMEAIVEVLMNYG